MPIARDGATIRQLGTLFQVGTFGTLTDGQLLERFATGHSEQAELAFAVLIQRHGPMVLRVCQAILHNEHESQDAFQATFLVLVRRSRSLWLCESLAPWLYVVAQRVARNAHARVLRRRRHEQTAAELRSPQHVDTPRDGDLERVLHEEIGRLPERCRVPLVLCLLEGQTHAQAARHLGWPVGTVKSRLAHGRERLRHRLIRRGLAPGVALAGTSLAGKSAKRAIPAPLAEATTRTAMQFAAGGTSATAIPVAVVSLAFQVQRSRIMFRLWMMTIVALIFVGIGDSTANEPGPVVSGVKLTFVDLQPKGNHRLADQLGSLTENHLANVPQGKHALGNSVFKIGERLIRVRGNRAPEPPAAVRGIAIDKKFDTLYILHSTMFGNGFEIKDGAEIGSYVVHYEDKTEERIPIIYGRDVRDWWQSSDPEEPSRGKLAWAGKNPAASETDLIRLYASEWKNPHPQRRVTSIDFESRDTVCAPFLVALTLERTLYTEGDSTGH